MTNAEIDRWAGRADLVARFGFLAKTLTKRACCGQRTTVRPDHDYIRQVLARLPADRLAEFRDATRT